MLGLRSAAAATGAFRGPWLRKTATTLGRYGVLQTLTQGLNALTGIVIVRCLPVDEFAAYTIALSIITAVSMATDSGVVSGLVVMGGKMHADPDQLGSLVASTSQVRRRLEVFALSLGSAFLAWRLVHTGAPQVTVLAVTLISAVVVHTRISIDVYDQILRLQLRVEQSLRIEAASAVGRLLMAGVAAWLLHSVIPVILAAVITTQVQLYRLRVRANEHINRSAPRSPVFTKKLWDSYWTQAASAFYVIVNGQATVLILSFFGANRAVAGMGALTRYNAIFALLSAVVGSFAYPRLARARPGPELRRRIALLLAAVVAIAVGIFIAVAAEPGLVLWVLGARYKSLEPDVTLYFACSSISLLVGVLWSINATRGWVQGSWINVPASIAAQCLVAARVDVGSIRGAIMIGSVQVIPHAIINVALMLRGLAGKGLFEDVAVEKQSG